MHGTPARKQRVGGFTLIELMIVVGIIGMLAALSIPLYDRYQAKTRQSEVKLALSAIFAGEKGFYSEYSSYISSFDALHYQPEASRRFYSIGWSGAMTGVVSGFAGVYTNSLITRVNTPPTFGCDPATAAAALPAPVGTDSQVFSVGGAGEVRIGQGCDVWTIDDDKNLQNTTLGT
jgi:type IV pilus assembly protein PilA